MTAKEATELFSKMDPEERISLQSYYTNEDINDACGELGITITDEQRSQIWDAIDNCEEAVNNLWDIEDIIQNLFGEAGND
jgi:hypothetical protein